MKIDTWWPRLRTQTQQWLIDNNGDVVPGWVMAEIDAAGGPAPADPWWRLEPRSADRLMPDDAVDWIEEVANAEPGAVE